MKHDDLINAMGNIDEKLVAAAAPGVRRKHHRPLWYAVIAACAAAVIAVSLLVPRFGVQNAPPAEQSTPATTTTVAPSQTEMTTTTTATQATTAAPTTASTPLHTSQKGTTTPSVAVTTTAPSTAYTQRPTKVVVFQNYYSTRLQAPEGSLPSRSLDPETKTLRSVTGFCFDIVRELYNGENMVVAPLPTYIQLAMLRHDRDAETRAQIEELLGIDPETGDAQLRSLIDKIVYDANGSYTKMANSLWFKGSSKSEEFLTNAIGYYDAEIFACRNTCTRV